MINTGRPHLLICFTAVQYMGPKGLIIVFARHSPQHLDHFIPCYSYLQGKIYNCGGGGSCGTCAVNVVAGMSNCSPKGPGEKKLLDKKPASYRLSCCTMVSGPVTIKTKP